MVSGGAAIQTVRRSGAMFKVVLEYEDETVEVLSNTAVNLREAFEMQDEALRKADSGEIQNLKLISIKRIPDWFKDIDKNIVLL